MMGCRFVVAGAKQRDLEQLLSELGISVLNPTVA